MTFTFSRNPIDMFKCWLYNKREEIGHWRWNRKHHMVRCEICGDILDSKKTVYAPEECGWENLTPSKTWICHRCLCHRDFKFFIKYVDEYENAYWERIKKIRNENLQS